MCPLCLTLTLNHDLELIPELLNLKDSGTQHLFYAYKAEKGYTQLSHCCTGQGLLL